jgi:hypothetical protein
MPAVQFVANIPQYAQDANNGQLYLVDDIHVDAIAHTGAVMTVDILSLTWKGKDVTNYVYECLPGTWDRIKYAAKAYYLTTTNVTS